MNSPPVQPAERVFVSYSHEGDAHNALVLSLTQRLWADGVQAFCDQYTTAPAEGWPRWMQHEIENADFVLIICTDTYRKRLSGDEVPGAGKGVIWEGNLIYQLIYNCSTANSRFIPVLLPGATPNDIPTPLQSVTHYDLTPPFSLTDFGYEELYRRITQQPRVHVPMLGPRQALIPIALHAQRERIPDVQKTSPSAGAHGSSDSLKHFDPLVPSPVANLTISTSLSLTDLATMFGLVVNVLAIISFIIGLTTPSQVVALAGVVWLLSLALAIWLPSHRRTGLIVVVCLPFLLGFGFGLREYRKRCPEGKVCVVSAPFDTTGDKTGHFSSKIDHELQIVAEKQYPELQPSRSYETIPTITPQQTFADARRTGATLIFWGDFETAVPNAGAGNLVSGYYVNADLMGLTKDDSVGLTKGVLINRDSIAEVDWKNFSTQNDVTNKAVYLTKVVLGLAASKRMDYEAAIARLSDALAYVPSDDERLVSATIHLFRGRAYAQRARFAEAIQDYKSVIASGSRRAVAYQEMGTAYFAQGLFDDAIKCFGLCIAQNQRATLALAFDSRGLAYLRRATAAEVHSGAASKDRDLASAETDFAKAIEIDSRFAPACDHHGQLNLARGLEENALEDFKAAIKIDPKYTEALENWGKALARLKKPHEAIHAYTMANQSTANGLDTVALTQRGNLHYLVGEFLLAIADFTTVLNCQPRPEQRCDSSKVALYEARGLAYGKIKQFDEALSDFGQALLREDNREDINADLANLYYNAGGLLKEKEEMQPALWNLSKAIDLNTKLAQAYYDRADLYKRKGDVNKAIEDLQRFLSLTTDEATKGPVSEQLEDLIKTANKSR
jgi:tetratricopeptide (TPR) repeat protein